jgi:hypothetical protein
VLAARRRNVLVSLFSYLSKPASLSRSRLPPTAERKTSASSRKSSRGDLDASEYYAIFKSSRFVNVSSSNVSHQEGEQQHGGVREEVGEEDEEDEFERFLDDDDDDDMDAKAKMAGGSVAER